MVFIIFIHNYIFHSITIIFFITGKHNQLPPTAAGTAEFLLFFDQLFDSVNSVQVNTETGKELRGALTEKSPHHEFWVKALNIIDLIKFIKKGKPTVIPSLKNWTTTIKEIKYLLEKLKKDFSFLCLPNLNQDPNENFFSAIRGHGFRNNNPTPQQFVHVYKSLLINHFVSSHSPGSNCEMDENGLLNNLTEFLTKETVPMEICGENKENINIQRVTKVLEIDNDAKKNLYSYIGDSIAKSVLKKIKADESE